MSTLDDLPTPALVVDRDRLEANLDRMARLAERHGVALRPHLKTHKSIEVTALQRARGCRGFTVSTLAEARLFTDAGFTDLTWAFPLILGRIGEAREIAEGAELGVLVDSPEAIDALETEGSRWKVWLKVDCGYHRAGVDPRRRQARRLARRLADARRLRFAGLLTHSGHAYHAPDAAGVATAARQEREAVVGLAERLRADGIEVPGVSIGSTPALTRPEVDLAGVTEIRPGNYAYFDYTQVLLGSCRVADCAATVVASVVSSDRRRGRSVIDAGALALTQDPGPQRRPRPGFGEIFEDYAASRLDPERRVVALSQEHGMVAGWLPVGARVRVLPNHSCLTVAQFDFAAVARGEAVVDRWAVHRRRT